MFEINVWTVLIAAALTAVATGLGAVPFLLIRELNQWWVGVANAIAAGLMLAASHSLIREGVDVGPLRTMGGMLVGLGLIVLADRLLKGHEVDIADLHGAGARKALLILGVMTAHSFAEGVGVGVSFVGGEQLGLFITAAIAVHNVPEGLAISLVLVPRGTPAWKAAGWSIFSSLPQPLLAVPAFLFVSVFEPWLPFGFGLAAGAMIWMVFAELIEDAFRHVSGRVIGATVTLAFIAMLAFQRFVLH